MTRITEKQLEAVVARINKAMNRPTAPYSRDEAGVYTTNVGNFHLSYAYGGVALHEMGNKSGGIHDVFRIGHMTKRELYNMMDAFLNGLAQRSEVTK